MVCQIVYVFYQMIFHESTREVIIKDTRILLLMNICSKKKPHSQNQTQLRGTVKHAYKEVPGMGDFSSL